MTRLVQFLLSSKKMYLLARVVLGLIFISSGILKMADLESFSKVVEAFAILPSEVCYPFAFGLSVFEIASGIGLCAGIRGSLLAVVLMLAGFVGVLSYAVWMGYDIDCGCFGPGDPEAKAFSGLKTALFRDLFFIALGMYLFLWQKKNSRSEVDFDLALTETINKDE